MWCKPSGNIDSFCYSQDKTTLTTYTPGSGVAGVIVAVRDHTSTFKKGDGVFTTSTISGGYAEYALAADHTVYPLPEKLDFKQGAAIGIPYFTAYRALLHR